MSFRLFYHPDVLAVDLAKINKNIQLIIKKAIERRLTIAPESYGCPLARNLSGYWKLRVGDYRIVFKIVRNEVWIFAIAHRKDIYINVLKRFF
ncbi:MAG: type II toxin-antitoxin system RelE family toxin [Candidatus Omnitrophota bacterium]